MTRLEELFKGEPDILRVIFSTSNPLQTLHQLYTEIPYSTYVEYLEYLDAKQTMEEYASQTPRQ